MRIVRLLSGLIAFILVSYTVPAQAVTGFTGDYAYGTWTSAETFGGATVSNVDGTNSVLTLLEPDSYPITPFAPQEFTFSHVVGASGLVSFDWNFDASIDACCSGLNFYVNGSLLANLAGGYFGDPYLFPATMASGSYSTLVNAGDTIAFGAFSADSCCGATVNTISNFRAPDSQAAVPEPGTWAMMLVGFGLLGGVMRRRQNAMVRFAV